MTRDLRKYLMEAYLKWMWDSNMVPYLVINTNTPRVSVPMEHANALGFITLNLSPKTIAEFSIMDSGIQFLTRFNRISHKIVVPYEAMMNLYDHGGTHSFDLNVQFGDLRLDQLSDAAPLVEEKPAVQEKKEKVSHLKLVK